MRIYSCSFSPASFALLTNDWPFRKMAKLRAIVCTLFGRYTIVGCTIFNTASSLSRFVRVCGDTPNMPVAERINCQNNGSCSCRSSPPPTHATCDKRFSHNASHATTHDVAFTFRTVQLLLRSEQFLTSARGS